MPTIAPTTMPAVGLPPLLGADYPAPVHYPWPEYVETARGSEWVLPTPPAA